MNLTSPNDLNPFPGLNRVDIFLWNILAYIDEYMPQLQLRLVVLVGVFDVIYSLVF
jgi:hypothetical protein